MKTGEPQSLRSYPGPWKGQLLLACGKCQRKLKKHHAEGNTSLKKLLIQQRKQDPTGMRLRVLNVPCLKMCPKDAVTVCTPAQIAQHECSIVRIPRDVAALYLQCKAENAT